MIVGKMNRTLTVNKESLIRTLTFFNITIMLYLIWDIPKSESELLIEMFDVPNISMLIWDMVKFKTYDSMIPNLTASLEYLRSWYLLINFLMLYSIIISVLLSETETAFWRLSKIIQKLFRY